MKLSLCFAQDCGGRGLHPNLGPGLAALPLLYCVVLNLGIIG